MRPGRRTVTLAVGLLVSGAFLWIVSHYTGLHETWRALGDANPVMILPFTACMLIFFVVRTYRWRLLLSPIAEARTRDLFGPVMIGYAGNFILPFQLGEVARTFATTKRTNLPLMPLAFSIVLERIFDLVIILVALAVSLPMHERLPGYVSNLGVAIGAIVMALVVLVGLSARSPELVLRCIERVSIILPSRARSPLLSQLRLGFGGFQSLRDARILLLAAATSVVQWALLAVCVSISLQAFGLVVPIQTVLLILALVVLGSSVPNAPGYVGSFQAAYVLGMEAIGGDADGGLAASIFYHVIYAAVALSLGVAAMMRLRLGWKSVSG